MAEVETKLVQVTKETWDRLGRLKKWGERMNFNEVIEWLLDQQQAREEAKELLK